jgi:hypothetical protein
MISLNKVKTYLSDLLGLPEAIIMDSSSSLSQLCLIELSSTINLPSGFMLTDSLRPPGENDYFLDIGRLMDDQRIVISRAKQSLSYVGLIVQKPASASTTDLDPSGYSPWEEENRELENGVESEELEKYGFNLSLCEKMNGLAMFEDVIVELVTPYVDTEGYVCILTKDTGKLSIVAATGLKNFKPPEGMHSREFSRKEEPKGFYIKEGYKGKVDEDLFLERMTQKFDLDSDLEDSLE